MRIAVTGATGHLGGLVIAELMNRQIKPEDIVAIVRNVAKAADLASQGVQVRVAPYEDEGALKSALAGVDRLVLVSGNEVGQRFAQHENIINAASSAGIRFIAYTSLLNVDTSRLDLAPEHKATEEFLAQSGIDHVILRNGWYWENFASGLESGKAAGKFFGAAGDAKVSGAARKDYASAAAVVDTQEGHSGKVYELAGAPALTYLQIAEGLGEVLGEPVDYVNQSVEEYTATLAGFGMPAEVAEMFAGMDPIIADGALYSQSTDLADLIGRPSTSLVEALSK